MMYKLFIFVFFTLLTFGKGAVKKGIFEKLSDINEQWLKATSFPEAAILLKHPPYSYHSKILSNNPKGPELNSKNYSLASTGNESDCSDDLIQIVSNLGSDWALQMLDSDGKLSSGILRGGVIWTGHFQECISAYSPKDQNGHGDFHGQYCVTSWNMNMSEKYSNLPLTVGLCVPDSCSETYIKNFGTNMLNILERFPVLKDHSSALTLKNVSCKLKEKTVDTASIIYLVFISLILCLSVIRTVVTILHRRKTSDTTEKYASVAVAAKSELILPGSEISSLKKSHTSSEITSEREISTADSAALTTNAEIDNQDANSPKEKTDSAVQRIWQCFSIVDNGKKILNTKSSGDQLSSIHGIRFLSLTWVILGHTYITPVSIIGNRLDVLKEMDSFAFQMLLQSPFSVDSFFLLSGFLLAYLFLKEADKKTGKINWIYFYVHRFWRLTPVYMIVVFFYILIFKYIGSGPFWDDNHCDAARDSWWKYLLYINNFIPINNMCVGWSWYLANDMQFYVISPLFLYPLWRWPIIGFSLLTSLLIGTWVITAVLSYHYDLIPMFVGVTHAKDFTAYAAKMWNSFDLIYDKPYCRIAPYLIGVALGFILYRINKRKNFLTWWQQLLGWATAAFCSLSVMFGLYHVEMSRTTSLFYNSLCRSSFSIGLAWLIFACETGHGGFINKLLTWKLFIPLSRLTYCAYLIHPIFIHAYYSSYQTAFYFTEYIAVTNFLGFLLMAYMAAFMFSVLFESPLMNLEKLVLKIKQK